MNLVASHLLIVLEDEENAFWVLAQLVQIVTPEYYSPSLGGLQADAATLSVVASHFVPIASESFQAAGCPTTLVAARWLMPLFAQSLPPPTLYRLWDLVMLERTSAPLLATALTVMRGAHADALRDFESAMRVLVDGGTSCFDAQPFLEHVLAYTSLLEERFSLRRLFWATLRVDSALATLRDTRLPRLQQCEQKTTRDKSIFDRWQIYRLSAAWASAAEAEAETNACTSCLSQGTATTALLELLPGLRRHEVVLGRLLTAMMMDRAHPPMRGVSLQSWLRGLAALHPRASKQARGEMLWRMCGGGPNGRARKEATQTLMAAIYAGLNQQAAHTVAMSIEDFFHTHSAEVHGLTKKATIRLLSSHPVVWHSVEWTSALCLGIGFPPLEAPPR